MKLIDTERFSERLRERAIIPEYTQLLITRLSGSDQEKDLSSPVNCDGYGRIRHFRLSRYADWSLNPLPILPASKALAIDTPEMLRVQVFQNAACNWRCWYCFVDFNRLSADRHFSDYFTADQLVDKYLNESDRPLVIDLTGGQPDLVPEWVLWMMKALEKRHLESEVFLWSDDNLSNDYFWRYLTAGQRSYIAEYPMYSRVACFKGYDAESFSFNTMAEPRLFDQQFELFAGLVEGGLDMYAYVTFTGPPRSGLSKSMASFVDRLQRIHPNLPLRTVPLKIEVFTPTSHRVKQDHASALEFQHEVHGAWLEELDRRFSSEQRSMLITEVPIE